MGDRIWIPLRSRLPDHILDWYLSHDGRQRGVDYVIVPDVDGWTGGADDERATIANSVVGADGDVDRNNAGHRAEGRVQHFGSQPSGEPDRVGRSFGLVGCICR